MRERNMKFCLYGMAPYRFLFMEVEYTWKQFNGEYDGYPMCAEVSMKFARVTTGNLTHDEIRTTITPT